MKTGKCAWPDCQTVIELPIRGDGYCSAHRTQAQRARWAASAKRRRDLNKLNGSIPKLGYTAHDLQQLSPYKFARAVNRIVERERYLVRTQ